jgi:signal transduction histidine kinase
VSRPDGRWVVIVGSSLDAADDAVSRVRSGLLLGGSLLVLSAAGGAWLLATLALRPVERMRRQAANIGEHDADTRLPVPHTRDEIAELADTMNALLARLQSALSQQRAFVADASHELRTPLAILRTELELATHPGRSVSDLRAAIDEAGEETERLTRLAEELLFLARHDEIGGSNERELQPLHPLLARAVENARVRAPDGIELVLDAPRDLVANVVGDDLGRAVSNLLDNALRHAAPATAIELRAERAGGDVLISVRDHGPGFPPDFLPHAFERFRRSDASRARTDGGTGLGLAIVRAVAREHGGDADAFNQPDGGAEVRIRVPAGA